MASETARNAAGAVWSLAIEASSALGSPRSSSQAARKHMRRDRSIDRRMSARRSSAADLRRPFFGNSSRTKSRAMSKAARATPTPLAAISGRVALNVPIAPLKPRPPS
jgi:hypothetical protein